MYTGPDAFLLESIFRTEAWNHLSAPVSEPNESAVYRSMMDGCRYSFAFILSQVTLCTLTARSN